MKKGANQPLFFWAKSGDLHMILSEFLASAYHVSPHALVLGHPVEHSRSPLIHNTAARDRKIDITYYAVDCIPEERYLIPKLFESESFFGANITIPLKKEISGYLDEIDGPAKAIGAVNTVVPVRNPNTGDVSVRQKPDKLIGYNTDVYGFAKPLEKYQTFKKAIILGSGGAARAVQYVLENKHVSTIYVVSRTKTGKKSNNILKKNLGENFGDASSRERNPDFPAENTEVVTISYDELGQALKESDILVNTTPVGMHPNIEESPVPDNLMPLFSDKICYDIIYNPLQTRLLKKAKKHGAITIGGLDMFIYQAARAFELWFQTPMPVDKVREILMTKS